MVSFLVEVRRNDSLVILRVQGNRPRANTYAKSENSFGVNIPARGGPIVVVVVLVRG